MRPRAVARRILERFRCRDGGGAVLRGDRHRHGRLDPLSLGGERIVGLKPTWGRVSRYGVFPLGESLDHIGPMTRSVADAALVLSIIAGRDERDDTSLSAPLDDYAAAIDAGASGIRVGVDEKYTARASDDVATAIASAVRDLERIGARVVKVELPDVEPCLSAWTTLCASEAAAGHAATYPSRAGDYGPGFRSFLELGTSVRGRD